MYEDLYKKKPVVSCIECASEKIDDSVLINYDNYEIKLTQEELKTLKVADWWNTEDIDKVDQPEVDRIAIAREIMAKAFEADPDFKRAYADNIAMLLYDHQSWAQKIDSTFLDFHKKETRDYIAHQILKLIFE